MKLKTYIIFYAGLLLACTVTIASPAKPIDQSLVVGIWYHERPDLEGVVFGYTEYNKDGTFRSNLRFQSSFSKNRYENYGFRGTWKIVRNRFIVDGTFTNSRGRSKHKIDSKIISLTNDTFSYRLPGGVKEIKEKVSWLSVSVRNTPIDSNEDTQLEEKTSPTRIIWENPVYPMPLLESKVKGHALVNFVIESNGYPRQVVAVESTNTHFAKAAVEAISQWRFKPAQSNGRYVAVPSQQLIEFDPQH